MCPPSTDPIRPVGPVSGDVYVGRAELTERVHRRAHEDAETDEQRRRRRRRQAHQPTPGESLLAPGELDAGTYDDHGRPQHRDEDELPPHPHIDATA